MLKVKVKFKPQNLGIKTVLLIFLSSKRSKYLKQESQHSTGLPVGCGKEAASQSCYRVLGLMLREVFGVVVFVGFYY